MTNSTITEKVGNYRWLICSLIFFATTVNYMDRQVIGILKNTLDKEIGLGQLQFSYVVTAFQFAYSLGSLLVGWFIDRVGTKLGYAISVIIWGLSSMSHALARTPLGFGLARIGLGIGESGNFPAANKTVAEWFPKKERALAFGIFNSGTAIGTIIALIIVPWSIAFFAISPGHPSWQAAFIITGSLDFVWLIFWLKIYNKPLKSKGLKSAELSYINSDTTDQNVTENNKVPWLKLFKFSQTWGITLAKGLTDCAWWFYLFWLPGFLEDKYHVKINDFANFALPLIIIYGMTMIGSISGGWISSALIKRGWTVNKARKSTMLVFAILIFPVILVKYVNLWPAVILIGLATACHQAWAANLMTTISDVFPKKATASVTGIGTTFATVISMSFSLSVGILLNYWKGLGLIETGYSIIFIFCSSVYIVGWLIFNLLAPKLDSVNID
jgi:MFS transporter, ACS family, hexuronate transporter